MIPADLFLSPDLSEAEAQHYLASLGFRQAAEVDAQLQRLGDDPVAREALGRLAADLLHALLESPDPDAAAAGVAHYVAARTGRTMFLEYLREDPKALHVLTHVMGGSPLLGEILVRTPEYFHWLVSQIERSAPDRQDHHEELASALATIDDAAEALDVLRRWKRREMLRIGARELMKHDAVRDVSAQLSDLAAVAVDVAVAVTVQRLLDAHGLAEPPGSFAVIATGRLASGEMSYDAPLDLLYVYEAPEALLSADAREFFASLASDLTAALGDETREGFLYRMAPHATDAGTPALRTLREYEEHYAGSGTFHERFALARACHVAGDVQLADRFLERRRRFVYARADDAAAIMRLLRTMQGDEVDDLDALTRALQIAYGRAHASLCDAGPIGVLTVLGESKIVPDDLCRELSAAYALLRTAEHRQQLGSRLDDIAADVAASQQRLADIRARLSQTVIP